MAKVKLHNFIVLATVIAIVNYDHTVNTIVNYGRKTFIVQATGDRICHRNVSKLLFCKLITQPQLKLD